MRKGREGICCICGRFYLSKCCNCQTYKQTIHDSEVPNEQFLKTFMIKTSTKIELTVKIIEILEEKNYSQFDHLLIRLKNHSDEDFVRNRISFMFHFIDFYEKIPDHLYISFLTLLIENKESQVNNYLKLDSTHCENHLKKTNKLISDVITSGNKIRARWIPTLANFLQILFFENRFILPKSAFEIPALNLLDLTSDFRTYCIEKIKNGNKINKRFTFCSYPFMFSLKDSCIMEMVEEAESTLKDHLTGDTPLPVLNDLFVNIFVRRSNLLEDSMKELNEKKRYLKRKLRVKFIGEEGLDMGGLTREWFLLIIREILKMNFFKHEKGVLWFHPEIREKIQFIRKREESSELNECCLLGLVIGLAMYNSIHLDINFPQVFYEKVLMFAKGQKLVATLEHMEQIDKTLFQSLSHLRDFQGNVEEELAITWSTSYLDRHGNEHNHEFIPNGSEIHVTDVRREEYIKNYLEWFLNDLTSRQLSSVFAGIRIIISSYYLQLLDYEDLENLICGEPDFNLLDLKDQVQYRGYTGQEVLIKELWKLLGRLDQDGKKSFLHFVTGSGRAPLGGCSCLKIEIHKGISTKRLPEAHTCFNILILPEYETTHKLEECIKTSINNSEGFGLK